MSGVFRAYEDTKFKEDSLHLIRLANTIIDEHDAQGLTMTLRQLYYQCVIRNVIPNRKSSYTNLGRLISDARLAGLVSWTALEDRGRALRGVQTLDGPGEAIRRARQGYRIDLWQGQRYRPEVWIEKAALEGVIQDICVELRVDFFASKGYNSQSNQWEAGQRFARYIQNGQMPIVFHLGDHDPSGIDMTRDNERRLSMFAGVPISVQRLALNMNQVLEYRLPPNPTKLSDSRSPEYIAAYGEESWELDALSPKTIRDLIEHAVTSLRDDRQWAMMLQQEEDDRRLLDSFATGFGEPTDD